MHVKFSQGLQTHSFGVYPSTQDYEVWPQETRDIALSYGVEISIDYCFVLTQCSRLTDGRTDGQTDVDSKTMRMLRSRTVNIWEQKDPLNISVTDKVTNLKFGGQRMTIRSTTKNATLRDKMGVA